MFSCPGVIFEERGHHFITVPVNIFAHDTLDSIRTRIKKKMMSYYNQKVTIFKNSFFFVLHHSIEETFPNIRYFDLKRNSISQQSLQDISTAYHKYIRKELISLVMRCEEKRLVQQETVSYIPEEAEFGFGKHVLFRGITVRPDEDGNSLEMDSVASEEHDDQDDNDEEEEERVEEASRIQTSNSGAARVRPLDVEDFRSVPSFEIKWIDNMNIERLQGFLTESPRKLYSTRPDVLHNLIDDQASVKVDFSKLTYLLSWQKSTGTLWVKGIKAGSCFLIAKNLVMTCLHVIERNPSSPTFDGVDELNIEVQFEGIQKSTIIRLVYHSVRFDIACLEISAVSSENSPLVLAKSPPILITDKGKQQQFLMLRPYVEEASVGRSVGLHGIFLFHDFETADGESGSPLIGNNGTVIGIHRSSRKFDFLMPNANFNCSVRIDLFLHFAWNVRNNFAPNETIRTHSIGIK